MKIIKKLRNYFFSCGIENERYIELKRDAYISNFVIWRALHFLMLAVFGALFVDSLFSEMLSTNRNFYLIAFVYSIIAVVLFFVLKKDSLAAQLIIYLSMSFLLLFGAFITANKPDMPATTFIVLIVITPMFMLDRSVYMAVELVAAAIVYAVWMYHVKDYEIWKYDMVNVITFTFVGIILHVIASSLRIREFDLTRTINIQKDTDELTGIRNKGAVTREINEYLTDRTTDKGILFIMDADKFKKINDTYGHDTGDDVIRRMGSYLGSRFSAANEVAGRFGGDEFIVFVKDVNDRGIAEKTAEEIYKGLYDSIKLPDGNGLSVSIGVAIYNGEEKNYSEILHKADIALYRSKADPVNRYTIYE